MSNDFSLDLPPADDAVAALIASPGFQAQMAAMNQQAMVSLQAMVAALNAAALQITAGTTKPPTPVKLPTPVDPMIEIPVGGPPKLGPTIIDIPYGLAVEPVFLAPAVLPGDGSEGHPERSAVGAPQAVLLPSDVITKAHFVEMLGMLPRAPSALTIATASAPVAAAAGPDDGAMPWTPLLDDRGAGEGGLL